MAGKALPSQWEEVVIPRSVVDVGVDRRWTGLRMVSQVRFDGRSGMGAVRGRCPG